MQNFWIVLFGADGSPKGDFANFMGHEEDFDPTDGLIKLGPLQAEHVTDSHCVSAEVDGREVGIGSPDIEFAVGDQFRCVGDDEFRKLFGDERHQAELIQIAEDDEKLAKLADWQPPKMLDVDDLPVVEIPTDISDELCKEVGECLGMQCINSTIQAVAHIDSAYPEFAAKWCARINPKILGELRRQLSSTMAFTIDVMYDRLNEIKSGAVDQASLELFGQELSVSKSILGTLKLIMPDGDAVLSAFRDELVALGAALTETKSVPPAAN